MSKAKKVDMAVKGAEIPTIRPTRLLQGDVDLEVYEAAERESKKYGMKKRQLMEWGLRTFLLLKNPAEAKRLGIKPEGE